VPQIDAAGIARSAAARKVVLEVSAVPVKIGYWVGRGAALSELPSSIVAVDVETTGLGSSDRIVTLGAWRVSAFDPSRNEFKADCIHIIADPGRKSHPRAAAVHGYSDWTLRHQEPFSEHAQVVRDFLSSDDIVIAHNASFDFGFIEREYSVLKQKPVEFRQYCTMSGYREAGLPGSASLTAICAQIGLTRIGTTHGALEDSWLALMIYFWLHKAPSKFIQPFSSLLDKGIPIVPSNFREPPSAPDEARSRDRSPDLVINDSAARDGVGIKEALFKAVRPTAILLLEIARADRSIAAAEIEIISTIIRNACGRLGVPINEKLVSQVLEELYQINVTQNLLTRSARSICEDLVARADFPKWVAAMAAADGGLSVMKREAVDRVKAAIQRVLPSTESAILTHPPSTQQ
jgi:DNA polymerase-3 subunit epsilon